jgi:hypothetical protein
LNEVGFSLQPKGLGTLLRAGARLLIARDRFASRFVRLRLRAAIAYTHEGQREGQL